jgi:hypothetical protein
MRLKLTKAPTDYAYLAYQTRALNYAPECLGPDEPLGEYFEQCFSCLATNNLDPVAYLGGFGELLAYCSTETSCQEGSSPCSPSPSLSISEAWR